ncbi:hypothetical protein CC80DRAFT_501188 [Byssothecium circinans]|uniref:Uncharacterized protein n=1 Tax=Byssothecium circinans TaxID=147558 RepID=A0A6A5U7P9_9PLEO|nr:hypothetical protein CC80DRAFT_501188 [Byssothecium circinans]
MYLPKLALVVLALSTLASAMQFAELLRFTSSSVLSAATPGLVPCSHSPKPTSAAMSWFEKLEMRQAPAPAPAPPAPVPVPPANPAAPVPNADPAVPVPPANPAVPNANPAVAPAPVNPAPVNPLPVDPAPANPAPVNPAPVNPAPVNPAPVNPAPAPAVPPAVAPAAPVANPVAPVAPANPPAVPPPPGVPAAGANPSVSISVTVQWVETWIAGSQTWVPTTATLMFKMMGETTAPAPGSGVMGMGTLTGKVGITRTIIKGAAETRGVERLAVGMGVVAGLVAGGLV